MKTVTIKEISQAKAIKEFHLQRLKVAEQKEDQIVKYRKEVSAEYSEASQRLTDLSRTFIDQLP